MTAVAAWLATPEERGLALSPHESRAIVHGLIRNSASAPLMALFNLATGSDAGARTRPPNPHELITRIGTALERRTLLIVPAWDVPRSRRAPAGVAEREPTPDDQLAESLMRERRDSAFEGQRYQLVPIRRWRKRQRQSSSSTDFRLMLPKDARTVLGRLSESPQASAGDRLLWKQALERLVDVNVARHTDEGVALLRYAPPIQRAVYEAAAPAPRPSQPRPLIATTDWIELEIVYEDGTPFAEDCALKLPDGRVTKGRAGKGGVVRVEGIDPGSCSFSLPNVQPDAVSAEDRA